MRRDNQIPKPRSAQIENFEARIVFASQILGDLCVADLHDELAPGIVEQQTNTLGSAHDQTGVSFVQNQFGFQGEGQTVAVIDSGIAWDHLALGNGLGKDYRVVGGWDFTEENDADPYDDGPSGYHGTHIAGIIGADDAEHKGVAPKVDFVGLRVFNDQGAGYFGWIEDALQWVHDNKDSFEHPITTVNLSIGTNWNDDEVPAWATLEDEFQQLRDDGIFVAVASGNSFGKFKEVGLSYPAVSPYVVPVGSVGADGDLSSFSQRHSRIIAAPGERIYSTVPDHVGNRDGIGNDWQPASGTSMASPYAAGASVLVREAMEFVGRTEITQDTIYNHLRATADTVYDSETNASYLAINLEKALAAIMPEDDFGSTMNTAHNIGSLGSDSELSGLVGTVNDRDYFTFTASASGTVQFAADATHSLDVDWRLEGTNASSENDTFSIDVVAGQQYTISLGTNDGIGYYEVAVAGALDSGGGPTDPTNPNPIDPNPNNPDPAPTPPPAPPMTDVGSVESTRIANQHVSGQQLYQVTASRSGIMTAEALFGHASGNVDIEIYDSQDRLVGTSDSMTDDERIDFDVIAGETYALRVSGSNADIDFRFTNLVQHENGIVSVVGTAGDDTFTFIGGNGALISINDVTYHFEDATSVNFTGNGGSDTAQLTGSAQRDRVVSAPGTAQLTGVGYQVNVEGITNLMVDGGGGRDIITLFDSASDDAVVIGSATATITGGGFATTALNFETVYAHSTAGGYDTINLHDTVGRDRLYASPTYARMVGSGYYHDARGFDHVIAHASSSSDVARLYDSSGSDQLFATPNYALLRGSGFNNEVRGFGRVYAYANRGGNDVARLYDSRGNDRLYATSTYAALNGDGFYNIARGFDHVMAYATGGHDTAYLYERSASDSHYERSGFSSVYGNNFKNEARGFDYTRTRLYGGGYVVNTIETSQAAVASTAAIIEDDAAQTKQTPLVLDLGTQASDNLLDATTPTIRSSNVPEEATVEERDELQRRLVAQYNRSVDAIVADVSEQRTNETDVFDALFEAFGNEDLV